MKNYQVNYQTLKGMRLKNDDACWGGFNSKGYFFGICCDGISSMPESSKLANNIVDNLRISFLNKKCFLNANRWINKVIISSLNKIKDSTKTSAGTTLSAALIFKNKMLIWNIGDSRIYQIKNRKVFLLTKDDNLFNLLVDQGYNQNDIDAIKKHENLLALTNCIDNMSEFKKLKARKMVFNKKSDLLIVTDGVYNFITESQIIKAIENGIWPTNIALKNGSNDNLSCVILRSNND